MMTGMQGEGLNPRTYSKAEYDTLRTASQRLEGEVANYRELLVISASVLREKGYPKIAARIDAALVGKGGE